MKFDLRSKSSLLSAYAKHLLEKELFPSPQAVLTPSVRQSEQAVHKTPKKMSCPVFVLAEAVLAVG